MNHPEYILIGSLGGLTLELLQLHIYRGRLTQKKYKALMSSLTFWLCNTGLILGAGLLAWGLNVDHNNPPIVNIFMTGIAARSVIRELLTAKTVNEPTKLGDSDISTKDIFS
jgi:hypothetical protein